MGAMRRDIENLKVAFDILECADKTPVEQNKPSAHLVLDNRMTLERKARWFKYGHRNPEPKWSNVDGVMSRESDSIASTYATLKESPICACDIQNACFQAPSSEKHYVVCGPDFRVENTGKNETIVRDLHGGKSSGADYWLHTRSAIEEMSFSSCKANPDDLLRLALKSNGFE